jgi:hypothetical protein
MDNPRAIFRPGRGPATRRGPRPLALHLALAAAAGDPAARLPERFLAGLQAYWRHPYRRCVAEPRVLWSAGSMRLLDYGAPGDVPLLAVPSLINRAYILDLAPGRSLLRHLAGAGLRPLLVDWGAPSACERRMTLDALVTERLTPALTLARRHGGRPALLHRYCMGGGQATASAARRPREDAALALLETITAGARAVELPSAVNGSRLWGPEASVYHEPWFSQTPEKDPAVSSRLARLESPADTPVPGIERDQHGPAGHRVGVPGEAARQVRRLFLVG